MEIAVDREYLVRTIAHLEQERRDHDKKFAGNEHHKHCLPRFDTALNRLQAELDRITISQLVK